MRDTMDDSVVPIKYDGGLLSVDSVASVDSGLWECSDETANLHDEDEEENILCMCANLVCQECLVSVWKYSAFLTLAPET